MKLTFLLSLGVLVFAKRDKRGEFYVQQPQFISSYPSKATYEQYTNKVYTPIYESTTPKSFTPVYSSTINPAAHTPGVSYVTPSNAYDDANQFVSITESVSPNYIAGSNQYENNNAVQYVTPAAYAVPGIQGQQSYLGPHSSPDYSIYNYAPGYYNYQYDVKAPEYGVDFGQFEVEESGVRRGRYYVLLPDGRRQVVDYTADSTGYHPRIRYEYVGSGLGHDYGVF